MKRIKYIILYEVIFLLLIVVGSNAQIKETSGLPEEVMAWTKSTMDTMSYKRYKSLKEAMIDNNFYIPQVFHGYPNLKINYQFSIDSITNRNIPPAYPYKSKKITYLFRHYKFQKSLEEYAYKNVLLKNPANFIYTQKQLPNKIVKQKSIDEPRKVKFNLEKPLSKPEKVDNVVKFIPDRKYWTSNAELSLKFTQSHVSPNWYNNKLNDYLSIYGRFVFYYNYAKNKTKLNNTLDASALFYNAPNDTLRNYRVGSDVLRFTSQLGYTAFGKWDYASSFTFTTQMFNNYTENTDKKLAGFLAPYKIDLTVGIKYTYNAKFKKANRAFSFPLSIDPLAFMFMQSKDSEMDLARHGFPLNDDGVTRSTVYHTLGSSVKIDRISAKFSKDLNMTWRLYYFTNYNRVIAESETNFNLQLGKYLATSFNIYLRYDDGVTKTADYNSYLQIYELLSFGFNYKW